VCHDQRCYKRWLATRNLSRAHLPSVGGSIPSGTTPLENVVVCHRCAQSLGNVRMAHLQLFRSRADEPWAHLRPSGTAMRVLDTQFRDAQGSARSSRQAGACKRVNTRDRGHSNLDRESRETSPLAQASSRGPASALVQHRTARRCLQEERPRLPSINPGRRPRSEQRTPPGAAWCAPDRLAYWVTHSGRKVGPTDERHAPGSFALLVLESVRGAGHVSTV
jgi:hypothetical protein